MSNFERAQFDGSSGSGNQGLIPENSNVSPEVRRTINAHVDAAKKDAIERTNGTDDAILRVENAIERRFRPYVEENEIIAQMISSPDVETNTEETDTFLDGRVAGIQCDDGRITADQIGDPRLISVGRRLQGMPEVRCSTKKRNLMILNDPDIVSSLKVYIQRQERKGNNNPHITEFVGPHIFSTSPTHGCGAEMTKIRAAGRTIEVGMWDGGINDYFDELGECFDAFDNTIEMLGGKGTTFCMTHDAYSQGLIFGLKEARHKFDKEKSLRDNLLDLAHSDDILMTELLDSHFYQRVTNRAAELGYHDFINLKDINHFGRNTILIGKIAREITMETEEQGFPWIPRNLIDSADQRAVRALGYITVRNVTRRVLGNIMKGNHDLIDHPEQLIAIGPIRAENVNCIPFIDHTSSGRHSAKDLDNVTKLNGLLEGSLRNFHGVDFATEGRMITTTGVFDATRFRSREIAEEAREEVNSVVGDNAAKIRDLFAKGVENGEIIVTGVLHEPKTSRLTHVVK